MQFLPASDPGAPMPQAAHGAKMTAVPPNSTSLCPAELQITPMSGRVRRVKCPGLAPADSGGLGGAVIRLDAVLAEQAAHPVELAVRALVLPHDGLDVDS